MQHSDLHFAFRMLKTNRSFALAFAIALCSCQKSRDYASNIIDQPGVYRCFGDQLTVQVTTVGTETNYSLKRKQTQTGPAKPPLKSGWAVYPETVDRIWVYDGTHDITLIEFNGNGGAKFSSSQVVPALTNQAPRVFIDRCRGLLRK